jgi:transposase
VRKAFTESIAEVPPRSRVTGRLCRAVARQVASGRVVSALAAEFGVSWPVVYRHFAVHADALLTEPGATAVLGIDETRRGRPRWRKSAAGSGGGPSCSRSTSLTWPVTVGCSGRQQAGLGPPSLASSMPAARLGRTRCRWWRWIRARPWRAAVERALPQAQIVVDHFHLVRLANQAITRVRQRITREHLGRRGTMKDPAWANRRRLLRVREHLSERAFARMWNDISGHEPTGQLLAAWIAKEELRWLLALAGTQPARSDISNRLFRFYNRCRRADVPEVTVLAQTVESWWPQILAFIKTGITNAATEANNRLIKDAARIAFGFRNLENQRRRVRLHCRREAINTPTRG